MRRLKKGLPDSLGLEAFLVGLSRIFCPSLAYGQLKCLWKKGFWRSYEEIQITRNCTVSDEIWGWGERGGGGLVACEYNFWDSTIVTAFLKHKTDNWFLSRYFNVNFQDQKIIIAKQTSDESNLLLSWRTIECLEQTVKMYGIHKSI